MSEEIGNIIDELSDKQRRFAEEYVIDWNATRAYQACYPDSSYDSARSSASTLLTNPNIQSYIKEIQKDLAKLAGVSALRNILELKKMAYSSLTDFKTDWMSEKEFDELTPDQRAALSEIITIEKVDKQGKPITIIKFKLHDKIKAIQVMNEMLGFNSPKKIEATVTENKPVYTLPDGTEITL